MMVPPPSLKQTSPPAIAPTSPMHSLPYLFECLILDFLPLYFVPCKGGGAVPMYLQENHMMHLLPPVRTPGERGMDWRWCSMVLHFWDLWFSALYPLPTGLLMYLLIYCFRRCFLSILRPLFWCGCLTCQRSHCMSVLFLIWIFIL